MARGSGRQLVWDLPTRLFHWVLIGLIGFSWWSAENHHLDWHRISGVTICGLLVFRILWGFFGTDTARFAQFVKGPRAVWAYLAGKAPESPWPGHNPLGGWSVLLMLTVLCVQVTSGLFAVDIDGIESGPLSYLVDFDQGRWAARVHGVSFNLLLALIALHIGAVLFYLIVKRRNLIGTMVTGYRAVAGGDVSQARRASVWRLVVVATFSVLMAYGAAKGFRL